jgi:WD40 repeat protein
MTQITTTHSTNFAPIIPQDAPVLQMPTDIVSQMLTHSSGQEIGRSAQVCKQWHQMVHDCDWRLFLSHHFPTFDSSAIQNCKDAYQAQFKLYSNLANGVYASHALQGHQGGVNSVAFAQGKLISGSADNTIKIWNLETGACTQTLQGHQGGVRSLALAQGKLISGSFDNTIKIWNLETGACTHTLQGHQSWVNCLAFAQGKLISGSFDNTIKIWDLETGACTQTLQGHQHSVNSLAFAQGKLISGSFDNTIKIWDLETGSCTQTLQEHQDAVFCVAFAEGKLISGSFDNTIKIWDLEMGSCTQTLQGHQDAVFCVAFAEGKLISGSCDNTIKIWDLETGACTQTLQGHQSWVRCLAFAQGKLISGSQDQTIKIWDFTADQRMVFQEIAELLKSENQVVGDALERFSRMPRTAKNGIYGKLYEICKPFVNEYWGCAEQAFFDQQGQSSSPTQKAEAITKYLDDLPPKNHPLLLAHLGIQIEKEYLEKLKCRSEHLQKIGIFSAEDIKLICSPSPHVATLETVEVPQVEENFRENSVKAEADRRKENLESFTEELTKIVESKIQETNTCGVLLYEGTCPWVAFQQKLNLFQGKLKRIAEESNTPKTKVEAFNSTNYNQLIGELNAFVEDFSALDRDHQITRLSAFINLWGILKAWNTLKSGGVHSLSALSESQLKNLFQMGE